MISRLSVAVAVLMVALPATAQEIPSPYDNAIANQGQRQLDDALARKRLEQAQKRMHPGQPVLKPKARAICRDRKRVAAGLSADQARELYSLCAQAGYK